MRAHRASWRFQSTNLCIFTAKPRDYAAIVTARDGQWDLGWEGVHGESKPKPCNELRTVAYYERRSLSFRDPSHLQIAFPTSNAGRNHTTRHRGTLAQPEHVGCRASFDRTARTAMRMKILGPKQWNEKGCSTA